MLGLRLGPCTRLPWQLGIPIVLEAADLVASGRAGKGQVQRMVRMLLALAEDPRTDVADALALALVAVSRRGLPLGPSAPFRGSL